MVKFVVNGSPFHYGRVLACYAPWQNQDDTAFTSIVAQQLVQRSQRPKIFIDPSTSSAGCLCLPFLHVDNWLSVTDATNFTNMGRLNVQSFDTLKHANGAADPVTITMFVWAEDVELSVPTLSLSMQAGESDEYGTGIISKPASAIASLASKLTKIPIIGPYAMATSLAGSAISSIAKLFGYSSPIVISDTNYVKRAPYGNLVNCDTADPIVKLTVDSKQELTIDSRVTGQDGTDEMTIQSIVGRESYMNSFPWTIAAAPDTLLFNILVHPFIGQVSGNTVALTPMAWAAVPFSFWSGSIIYRFQIVASQYHRGRIKVSFDPVSNTVSTSPNSYNMVYTRVVDLAEERDFEIEVTWASVEAYKALINEISDVESGSTVPATLDLNLHNGLLAVHVVNELTAPTIAADISINVFARAGDDFELAVPHAEDMQKYSYFEQSGESDEYGENVNDPAQGNPIEKIGEEFSQVNNKPAVFFGEKIVSFRTLLKRYTRYMTILTPNSTEDRVVAYKVNQPNFPLYPGPDPDGIHATALAAPFNYTYNTLINWLTPAYIARRGSIRYRVGMENYIDKATISMSRRHGISSFTNTATIINPNSVSSSLINFNTLSVYDNGFNGITVTPTTVSPQIDAEIPFYSPHRFAFGRVLRSDVGSVVDNTEYMRNEIHAKFYNLVNDKFISYREYVSTGEDFNLSFFLNVPMLFEETLPAPAI